MNLQKLKFAKTIFSHGMIKIRELIFLMTLAIYLKMVDLKVPWLLQIFRAYCPYSVKEISVINQLGKTYRDYGLRVIVFSRDTNKSDFVRFLGDTSIYFEPIWLTSREYLSSNLER